MNKYYFIHLFWLLPAYFLVMSLYQYSVLRGINQTYESGDSYIADVIDFDVKQIAAQTSGYVILSFDNQSGEEIEQRLSLSVQMAQVLLEYERIPIRYLPESPQNIVILPTFDLQKNVVYVNLAVTSIGFLVTLVIALFASRYANRKIRDGDDEMIIERIDNDNS